jgi:1,2-diacylglycerol 3-alpha-glucosyltransferase
MEPVDRIPGSIARTISFVLTDIDDTMTKDGKVLPEAYAALWMLKEAGFIVIPVTGRPAGWCDLIARQWPVDAVIGENGAFVFYLEDGRVLKQFFHPSVEGGNLRERLKKIEADVLAQVPGTRIAKDQFCRLFDLAIDFREEPPFLGLDEAERIKRICEHHGAKAKISSIHVNTWFGEYDKLSMARLFLGERYGVDLDKEPERVFFCGDSPNDEPMFAFFPYTCGVANIGEYLHLMTHLPRYVTEQSHGKGFAEAAGVLQKRRESHEREI